MSKPTLLLKGFLIETQKNGKIYGPNIDTLKEKIPVEHVIEKLAAKAHSNSGPQDRIFIVKASTGSGKTTIIPPEFLYKFYPQQRRNIAVTQPRVLNAIKIPKDIAARSAGKLTMGENIGYQTGNLTKKPARGINFMTIGVILQQLLVMDDEAFINKYGAIIIDEAHEMSISTELALLKLKALIERNVGNPRCPFLIIMSATFDPFLFADYLLSEVPEETRYLNITSVSGFNYPIKDTLLEYSTSNYYTAVADLVEKLHKNTDDLKKDEVFRDILIFVAGIGEITKVVNSLLNATKTDAFTQNPVEIIELSGAVVKAQSEKYKLIEAPYNKKMTRRVIIATNVAETGVTINTLKYVIDTGYYKSQEYNPNLNAYVLYYKPVSDDMRRQRRGRVGRLAPGVYYGLYTQETVNAMLPQSYPEIYKSDIALEVLNFLEVNPDITSVRTLNSLSAQHLSTAMEKLYALGAVSRDGTVTDIGKITRRFRFIPLESIRMILAGLAWNVRVIDLIDIACILECNPLTKKTNETKLKQFLYEGLPHTVAYYDLKQSCQFLFMLLVFRKYQSSIINGNTEWIDDFKLNREFFTEALKLRDELYYISVGQGIDPYYGEKYEPQQDPEKIKRCIYEGYKLNLLRRTPTGYKTYKGIAVNMPQKYEYYIYYKLVFKLPFTGGAYGPVPQILSVFDGIPIDFKVNL